MTTDERPVRDPALRHCMPDDREKFPGQTRQAAKDECDVNRIMSKWRATGSITHLNLGKPAYGDYSTSTDYLEAIAIMDDANASFAALPAAVRARMNNNPAELLDFIADPANTEEATALGLINAPANPVPTPAPEGEPAPTPPAPSQPPSPVAGGE